MFILHIVVLQIWSFPDGMSAMALLFHESCKNAELRTNPICCQLSMATTCTNFKTGLSAGSRHNSVLGSERHSSLNVLFLQTLIFWDILARLGVLASDV